MTPRERVIRTLNHRAVDRAPRDLWLTPGMETDHAEEVSEIGVRFPLDILQLDGRSWPGKRSKTLPVRAGHFTDAWGCCWQLNSRGVPGVCVESPLADPAKIAEFQPPHDLLDHARFTKAERSCEGSLRFVLAWSDVRPLDRVQALCGPTTALAELAAGGKEVRGLLEKLHAVFCRELERWAETSVDGVAFRDDLGTADGLKLATKAWRNLLKPLYREYCEILHARDKFVLFHSEGNISEVFGDLVETGVDAIHSQLFLMDVEKLAERYRGRVTFCGELDRQPPGCPPGGTEVCKAVLRVRRALDFGAGGVIANCHWTPGIPIRQVAAFFEEWMMPLPVNV